VKAPSFAYAKARNIAEVFDLLDKHGEDARILAGGQSLMPTLNFRLSKPAVLIDINGLSDLSGIRETANAISIGALTRHATVEASPLIAKHVPLVAAAMPHIAHPAIRNRGTIGGSLALADPAAELPACAVALGATMIVRGRKAERRVPASSFFKGLFSTEIGAGEILAAVEFPKATADDRFAFDELARRHGDYAIVGVAAAGQRSGVGFANLNLVYFGIGSGPVAASAAAAALAKGGFAALDAAKTALDGELDPTGDLNGSPAAKRHLAGVLLRRVAARLFERSAA